MVWELTLNQDIENKLTVSKGEFGINIYTLLYIKQITNKDLLYITGDIL